MQAWAVPLGVEASSRRERRRARRVNEILRHTAVCVAERGYHDMSLEDVAERLDVAKASLYHYFGSKEELVYTCLEQCHEYVTAQLRLVAAVEGPPLDRLRRMIARQLELTSLDAPESARLFLYPLDWPEGLRRAVKGWRDEHRAVFAGVLDEAIAAGALRPQNVRVSLLCLFGALNAAPMWLERLDLPVEEAVTTVVGTVLKLFDASGE
jgi:AcrR family transcriptional regulator